MRPDHPNTRLNSKDVFIGYGDANRYKSLGGIGQGAYGIVYSAIDTHTNEKVAIKVLQDVFRDVPRAVQFLREIKLLRLLQHPNIVKIRSIVLPPSSDTFNEVSVVCELMDMNLDQGIRLDDNLTPEHQRYFLYQILCALKYMHAANVYHLDLKPENVLINKNGLIKVCDLGLSRVAFREPSTVWRYGGYVVTAAYRAPEISGSNNSKYPHAVDIWSLGCIFAEILTRKQLFPRTSLVHQLDLITDLLGTPSSDTISKIPNDKARKYLRDMRIKSPVPFAVKFPNSDPLALQLLQKLLAFDPKDRPTVEEALADEYFSGLPKTKSEASQLITEHEFAFESCNSMMEIRKLMYHEILAHHPQLQIYSSQVPVCYVPIYYDPACRCYYYLYTMPLVHGGTGWPVNTLVRQDIFLLGPMTGAIQGNLQSTQWPPLCESTAPRQPLHLPYTYSSMVTGELVQAPVQQLLLPSESSGRNVTGESVHYEVPPWPLFPSNASGPSIQENQEKSVTEEGRNVTESSGRNVTGVSAQNQVPPLSLFPSNASRTSMQVNQEKSVTEEGRYVTGSSGKNVTGESVQYQVPRPLFPSNASRPSMKVNQEKSVTEESDRESSLLRQLQDLNIKPCERNEDEQYSGLGLPSGSSSRNVTRESVQNQVTPQPVFPCSASRTSMEVNQVNVETEANTEGLTQTATKSKQ